MRLQRQLILAMTVMLLVSASVALLLLRSTVIQPAAVQMADNIVRQLQLLELNPQTKHLLAVYNENPQAGPLPERNFYRVFEQRVKALLGVDIEVNYARDEGLIWIRYPVANSQWIGLQFSDLSIPGTRGVLLSLLLAFLLALFTGWVLARYITSPLQDLSTLTQSFSKREKPADIEDKGPAELRTLRKMMHQAALNSHQISEDRKLMMVAISHDLRAPMARLRFASEMLASGERRDGIIEDLEEMDEILGGFIALIRGSDGEALTEFDLIPLLQTLCQRQARVKQPVEFNPPAGELVIKGQRLAIERIFTNLIENAFKHGKPPVIIGVNQSGSRVQILIEDHGVGVSEEYFDKLYQPFWKVGEAREKPGAGLGLAIVAHLLKSQNGNLSFSRGKSGGLQVLVELPYDLAK